MPWRVGRRSVPFIRQQARSLADPKAPAEGPRGGGWAHTKLYFSWPVLWQLGHFLPLPLSTHTEAMSNQAPAFFFSHGVMGPSCGDLQKDKCCCQMLMSPSHPFLVLKSCFWEKAFSGTQWWDPKGGLAFWTSSKEDFSSWPCGKCCH
jgi:hypothetical protein